jgi:uncharacterized cofD-like protein
MKTIITSNKVPRIVTIGGGTGLSTLLRGLKKYSYNLTAIVAVTDDGGSSGALRRELGVLPPGDIRNCLVALSEEENLMAQLFQYRFPAAGSLSGHSFGNLFLTAMASLAGGFDGGIARASEVLAIRGQVLPVTLRSVTLQAMLDDGRVVIGESNIAKSKSKISQLTICPYPPPAGPKVLEAIASADVIVIGPGSLYTSVVANLLVEGVVKALAKVSAPKIYVCNIMTQPGETLDYSLTDHLTAIENHVHQHVLDYVIVNNGSFPKTLLKRYAKEHSFPVKINTTRFAKTKIIKADLVSPVAYARHDPDKLAAVINKIVQSHRITKKG